MAAPLVLIASMLPPAAGPAMGAGTGFHAVGSLLLIELELLGLFGLLLGWALPVTLAGLLALGAKRSPASLLLWAALLGWIGVALFLYRGAEPRCPHCRMRLAAETPVCYWCEGETRPTPLPAFLRAEEGWTGSGERPCSAAEPGAGRGGERK